MFGASLVVAVGLLPVFQPTPSLSPQPLMWEIPVSQTTVAVWSPGESFFSAAEVEKVREALAISLDQGPEVAVASLAKSPALPLILIRAVFKEEAGDLVGAMEDYKRVLASKNMTEPRALALDGYKRMLKQLINDGDKSLYKPLVQILKDEWLNEEALELLPKILVDPEVPKGVKDFVRKQEPIMALRLGQFGKATQLWSKPKTRVDIQWLSNVENRQGNFVQASRLREKLGQSSGPGWRYNKELYTAFEFLAKGGLYAQAGDMSTKYPFLKKVADYQWRLGLAALAAGGSGAEAHFQAVLDAPSLKKRHPGAKYFLARSQEINGQKAKAAATYRELAEGSFNYYHILARGRLQYGNSSDSADLMSQLLDPGPGGRDCHSLGYYLWITEKGLNLSEMEEAAEVMVGLGVKLLPSHKELTEEFIDILNERDWEALTILAAQNGPALKRINSKVKQQWALLLASATARSGDYRQTTRLFSRIAGDGTPGLKRWSHPLIYAQEVRRAHRDLGISPALLLALIRTESAFQDNIMSRSNARGLMQLLPATAAKVATALGEDAPGPMDMFEPAQNIRYGSWYLKELIEGFGHEHLALAGYNGGPYNIKSMILAKKDMPLDVFVESLPFEETANYVKRITESRFIYESVYLGEVTYPDLTAPVAPPKPSLPTF